MTPVQKNLQQAQVALVNLWYENEANRFQRQAPVDPWKTYDNFRINHRALRTVKMQEGADDESPVHELKVEYLSENKFNVYTSVSYGHPETLILGNAEVFES